MLKIFDLDYISFIGMKIELSGGTRGGMVDTFVFTSAQDDFALSIAEASSFGNHSDHPIALTKTDTSINKRKLKYGVISKSSASANAFAFASSDYETFSSSFNSYSRFSSRTYNISA